MKKFVTFIIGEFHERTDLFVYFAKHPHLGYDNSKEYEMVWIVNDRETGYEIYEVGPTHK